MKITDITDGIKINEAEAALALDPANGYIRSGQWAAVKDPNLASKAADIASDLAKDMVKIGDQLFTSKGGAWFRFNPGQATSQIPATAAEISSIKSALAAPEAEQAGRVYRYDKASGKWTSAGKPVDMPELTGQGVKGKMPTAANTNLKIPKAANQNIMGELPPSEKELSAALKASPEIASAVEAAPWYQKWLKVGGEAVKGVTKVVDRLTIPFVAAVAVYDAYQQIKALPADDPNMRKNATKIILGVIDEYGFPLVAFELGSALAGTATAATGVGAVVSVPAAMAGGIAASVLASYTADQQKEWINWFIDQIFPDTMSAEKTSAATEPSTRAAADGAKATGREAQSTKKEPPQGDAAKSQIPVPPVVPGAKTSDTTSGGRKWSDVEIPYVEIGPNMDQPLEFSRAKNRIFGNVDENEQRNPLADTIVKQLIDTGLAQEYLTHFGFSALSHAVSTVAKKYAARRDRNDRRAIAGMIREIENKLTDTLHEDAETSSNQVAENWKNDLMVLAATLGLGTGAYDTWAKGGNDTRTIGGQEVRHFDGVPGQKIQPISIEKHVTIDGKPATVWQGKDASQRGIIKWYWNFDDEPTMRNPIMKNVMDEDVLIPKGAVNARKRHTDGEDADSPGIGDLIIMELGDGRAIEARISELRGNSMVLDLDETAHQWIDESPDHHDLMISGDDVSTVADIWNRMVLKLPADTPAGWAAVFASEEARTGHASRSMPRQWSRIWRQQHEALGDSLTRADALAWADDVEAVLDGIRVDETAEKTGASLRKVLDPRDPAMLAIWMAAHAGTKGRSIKGFAQQTARAAGHPEDTYWDKIKRIVSESKHGRRALMRLYDIEPVTAVDDDFVIASDVHEYDDNRKLTWNLYKKVVPTQDKMEPAYYHVAHLDLSPYGDFTKDQLMAAARDAMKNADVMVDEDDSLHKIIPHVSVEEVINQVFDVSKEDGALLRDTPYGYQGLLFPPKTLDGNEELAIEQALFRAGYDIDRVQCMPGMNGSVAIKVYLKSKPESDVSEARPDVLGMAESAGDHQSVEKRYYIVRKGKPPAATPGIQGFHSVSAAEDKLNSMSDPDAYNIVAIDSPKKDVRADEAKYQGREVKLGKPIRTNTSSGGKFKVYVRDPKTGNIKMVRFGDTTGLTIKRDDPKRRKNFRARHHCDNPGPRTKARYWSCRMWTAKPVGKILKGK